MSNASRKITRRTLVAGAAAGTMALASAPASAQRCPPVGPRTKGPAVFRDLDQLDIDEGYDNDVYAFNSKTIGERRVFNNRIALSVIGKPERVKYGEAEIERVDIYKAKQPNAPVMIFIHGGSWRGGRAEQFTVYAEPFVKAGANFVVVDFTNVGETKGDIFPMVDQVRRAVAWTWRNAKSFGGNADALYLISRSSGSHLASCILITEWEKQGLPRNILKGAVMGSGMYDLAPVRLSKRSSFVKFTDAMVAGPFGDASHRQDPHAGGDRRRRARDAGVPAAGAGVRGRAQGRRQARRADRRARLQSLRDRRDDRAALRGARPRRVRHDGAEQNLSFNEA